MAEKTETEKIYSAPWWLRQIARYEKTFEPWTRQGEKLLKLYAKQSQLSETSTEPRRFAMLYANTEVIKPSVYSRPPVPQASRRFKDKDPVGRIAAEFLERSSAYELERQTIDHTFRSVRDDLTLPGRGTVWLRYEAEFEEDEVTLKAERVPVDYVNWKDFGHLPARVWAEVDAIWRRVYYSRAEVKRQFGADVAEGLEYTHKRGSSDESTRTTSQDDDAEAKAACYEIWCKKTKKQYIVAKEFTKTAPVDFLREPGPPPLDFENFWPCPKPVYSLVTTENLIPTPDYKHYQDQAQEIDDLTARIGKLTDALKVVGFYPLGAGDVSSAIEKAFDPNVENRMIGVESWAVFAEKGGSNAIVFLPIKEIADTITACVTLRNQLVQDVYQISGISDILRGSTDPNETLGAQELKSQWGSVRIKDRQQGMADFCRDVVRLVCEVIAERFDPERVLQMANMELGEPPPPPPPDPMADPMAPPPVDPAMQEYQQKAQQYQAAFQMLQDEKLRGFRIDIETDSTIQPDEDAEKQRATEFVTAFGGILQQAVPLVGQVPELAPMVSEVLLFAARRFRAGRMLEDSIEQSLQAVQQKITQMQEQQAAQPTPEQMQAQQAEKDGQAKQAEAQAKADAEQQKMQQAQADDQAKAQEQAVKEQRAHDLAMEQERTKQAQYAFEIQKHNDTMGLERDRMTQEGNLRYSEMAASTLAQRQKDQQAQQASESGVDESAALMALVEEISQQNAALAESFKMLAKAMMAPKSIKTPEGRVYTTQVN